MRKQRKQKTEVDIKIDAKTNAKEKIRIRKPRRPIKQPKSNMAFAEACKEVTKLRREVTKLRKCENGPKIQSTMETTVTLGPVNGNLGGGLERSHRQWLSPILLKTQDQGAVATPLSTRASQYNLYKILKAEVVVTPLVGKAMVAGTVVLADVDQESSSAKPDTVDSVKSRSYIEVSLGSYRRWRLPATTLRGPREGWWLIDSNEQPTSSLGPAVNVWTYMQTRNLMGTTNEDTTFYTGTIALIEMRVKYAFANYNPKPALAQLIATKEPLKLESAQLVNNTADTSVMLEVDANSKIGRMLEERDGTQKSGKGSTFWSVAGDVVNVVAPALGPWGWLLRGGFFFIRRIFGKTENARAGKNYYQVYSSVEDAARDLPIYQPLTSNSTKFPEGHYHWQQLNSENLSSQSMSIIPKSTTLELMGNFLPVNYAPDPEEIPPPAYAYKNGEEYAPSFPNILLPPAGGDDPVDNIIEIEGEGTWYWLDEGEYPERDLTLKFTTYYGQGQAGGSTWFLNGTFLNFYDLSDFGQVVGHNEARTYGLMHTASTFMKSLDSKWEKSESSYTPSMPSQVFLHLSTWSPPNSRWEAFMQHIRAYGERTVFIPVHLCDGELGNVIGREGEAAESGATGVLLVNLEKRVMGIIFVTNDWPEALTGQFHKIWACNARNWTNFMNRRRCFVPHAVELPDQNFLDEKTEKHSKHPAPEQKPTDPESDSDYEVIKKKKKIPKRI